MIARWLAREVREFPATILLCLSWIVVFGAMTWLHLAMDNPLPLSRWLMMGFGGGEPFGDLTLADLGRGQVWRLLTCNFIHYSVVHLGLNLLAMYQLGSLLESWYGPYQLVFLYGLTGGLGNALSAGARTWLHSRGEVHSAGGSVAIMGMVGVCAVAGWRSHNPEGRRLARLMLIFIGLTALLGAILSGHVDNWGHAGGLVIGLGVGLWHRRLLARVGKPAAWGAGMLTIAAIVGAAGAQYLCERREAPARLERALIRRANYLERASVELNWVRRPNPPTMHLIAASKWLDVLEELLTSPGRAEIRALRPLLAEAREHPPSAEARRALDAHLGRLLDLIRQRYRVDRGRLSKLRGVRDRERIN